MVVLRPHLTVPQSYLPADDQVDYSAWTPVLYNGQLAYVQRSSFVAKGKKLPTFYCLYTDDDNGGYFATARQNLTVYSKPGKGTKLGAVAKDSMVLCVSSKQEGYLRVILGPDIGYVKTGDLQVAKKDKLNLAVGKAAGTYLEPLDWDYMGRVSTEDREAYAKLYSGVGALRVFQVEEGDIYEFQLPTEGQADATEKVLKERHMISIEDIDTQEFLEFESARGAVRCYRNNNTLICCQSDDPDLQAAVEAYHGEPFLTF